MESVKNSQENKFLEGEDKDISVEISHLLSDEPVSEDKLGTHTEIARQLQWLIKDITHKDSNNRKKNVIGLFGTWGSGKSTVIKILKNKVSTNKQIKNSEKSIKYTFLTHDDEYQSEICPFKLLFTIVKFCIKNFYLKIIKNKTSLKNEFSYEEFEIVEYDSWSHRDEHLKRAFLLHIMKSLGMDEIKYDNVNGKSEDNEVTLKNIISGKVKKQTIVRDPSEKDINFWLFLVGFILFLGAISVSLNEIWKLLFLKDFFQSHVFPLIHVDSLKILSIIQLVSLLGVPILFCLLWWRRKAVVQKLLYPFLNIPVKVSENVTSFGEADIPSLQFQEYFKFILSKWLELKENSNKTLIIVLDNLDRVSDEMVSRFFSLIQSALDAVKSDDHKEVLQEKVVFIVPIDKERVLQVFGKMIQSENTKSNESSNELTDPKFFKEDFLKKLFPYAVEVPDLVDSNWRVFFKEKLIEVFPQMEEALAEISLITGIFHRGISQNNHKITPREIIHFINEMAINASAYKSIQAQDLTPTDIVLIALYTAIKRYDSNWFKEHEKVLGTNKNFKTVFAPMLTPYIGIIIPENYDINILQLHYRTRDVWDLLFSGPFHDILAEGGEKAYEIIDKQIKPKVKILISGRKQVILNEYFETFLQEESKELSASPVKIGRSVWLLQQLELNNETLQQNETLQPLQQQLWLYLQSSVKKESPELETLDRTAKEGLLKILSWARQDKTTVIQSLAQHFVKILDKFKESMEGSK